MRCSAHGCRILIYVVTGRSFIWTEIHFSKSIFSGKVLFLVILPPLLQGFYFLPRNFFVHSHVLKMGMGIEHLPTREKLCIDTMTRNVYQIFFYF